jgi:hypothetical protein
MIVRVSDIPGSRTRIGETLLYGLLGDFDVLLMTLGALFLASRGSLLALDILG